MSFKVSATTNRDKFHNYYMCYTSKSNYKKYGKYIVVYREHNGRVFVTMAHNFPKNELDDNTVEIDQTIRAALVIERNKDEFSDFTETVEIAKLYIGLFKRVRNSIASLFKFRYTILRFNRPDISDAEKGIIRTTADTLKIVGVNDCDSIVIEYPSKTDDKYILKSISVQALTKDPLHEKDLENTKEEWNKIDNFDDPLDFIQIDYDIRRSIGTSDLQPIYVRRDVLWILMRQVREVGVTFMITIVALLTSNQQAFSFVIIISISLLVTMLFSIINIRSTLK